MVSQSANSASALEIFSAVVTSLAVVLALFREYIARWIYPPKLDIELARSAGEATRSGLSPPAGSDSSPPRVEKSRYFHVRVTNPRRFYVIGSVEVALLRVQELDDAGNVVRDWEGDVPLQWRHMSPHAPRAIGTPYDADLFSVVRDKWLELHPTVRPLILNLRYTGKTSLRLVVQARGEQCESGKLRLSVKWDGDWSDDTERMREHLIVEKLSWALGDKY